MRIALYHDLPSGGAKRTLMEATRRLAARHQIDAYTLSSAEHDFGDIRPWVGQHHVFPFQPSRLLESPFGRLNQVLRCADLTRLRSLAARIAEDIDRGGYDVALVHPCRFEQSPSVLRFLRRTRSIYYCQEPRRASYETMPERPYDDDASPRRRMLNRVDPLPGVYRRMARRADQINTRSAGAVLVSSSFMTQTVAAVYAVQAQVSHHGVDITQFRPLGLAKRRIVLSVGSLTPLKGFDFLVRAMAEYPDANRPPLVIASNFQNPPERTFLEQLARQLRVELVLLGAVSEDDLVRLYNEALIVAYAPVREPFGLVPLEAMACGTPVVGIDEGGVAETVIDEETGSLVGRDPHRFAAAIHRLANDAPLARRLGENGRAHVLNNWTWERAVARLESSLQAIAGQSPVARSVPAFVQ